MNTRHVVEFTFNHATHSERRAVAIERAIIAGWTGRDVVAMEKHIHELEEIGVPRPKTTPTFYRVGARRITTDDRIEVSGASSSGEVEFILLKTGGELWVGIGSDHTDRKVETYGITVSKQMCDKPVGIELWAFADVEAHWDQLLLRATLQNGHDRALYQDGGVTAMRHPLELIGLYERDYGPFEDGSLMFCGTLAAIGGIRPAERFEIELIDPVRGRAITHGYDIACLPIVEWD